MRFPLRRGASASESPPVEHVVDETPVAVAAPPAPAGDQCRTCGAGMAADQDWCLECGTAAPGRLGARPGWRLGALALSVTLMLVAGATVAGYAAVTGDAERDTSAQSADAGTPVPAQLPAAPAPARPTSTPKPQPTPTVDTPTTPDITDDIDIPTTPTPVPTPTPTPTPSPTATTPTTDGSGGTAAPEEFPVKASGLEVYDQYERAGAEFGDPEDALRSKAPFFDITVPADGEDIGAGLKVDLGAVRKVKQITFTTTTPEVGLEIYGIAKGEPNGLKAGWRLLQTPDLSEQDRTVTIDFDGVGVTVRRLVLFFTTPADAADPRASLGDLKVLG